MSDFYSTLKSYSCFSAYNLTKQYHYMLKRHNFLILILNIVSQSIFYLLYALISSHLYHTIICVRYVFILMYEMITVKPAGSDAAPPTTSFPSGHMANECAIAFTICQIKCKHGFLADTVDCRRCVCKDEVYKSG